MMIEIKNELVALSTSLEGLNSEKTNILSSELDKLSALEIAQLMNAEDAKVSLAVSKTLGPISQAIEAAARALRVGGRVIYIGAGTSGRLGILDASEIPPTFSAPHDLFVALIAGGRDAMFRSKEGAEDDALQGVADLREIGLSKEDFVVGLAVSGRTPYVLGAIKYALDLGVVTAGVSCNGGSELDRISDIAITPIVGPEILTGSTRLKSGTAQKQVLNMISTGAMVQIGKCFGNRMVDMNASNEKLKARAINLVTDLTSSTKEAALDALTYANWDIKSAILMEKTGMNAKDATKMIKEQNGHLRHAIAAFESESNL